MTLTGSHQLRVDSPDEHRHGVGYCFRPGKHEPNHFFRNLDVFEFPVEVAILDLKQHVDEAGFLFIGVNTIAAADAVVPAERGSFAY